MDEKIIKILGKYLDEDAEFNYECNLSTDLGLDSMDYIEIITEIEDVYGIQVNDEELVELETVGDIVDYIDNKIADH